jgi:MFS family permease
MGVAMVGRLCIGAVYSVIILHTAELFPTVNRNAAVGTSSTMSHVGSLLAPYIVDLLVSCMNISHLLHSNYVYRRLKFFCKPTLSYNQNITSGIIHDTAHREVFGSKCITAMESSIYCTM